MTTTSKPILTYFNGRGLGEIPRLIFAEAGVDFEVSSQNLRSSLALDLLSAGSSLSVHVQ